ncbi:hypothetical protein ACIRPK_33275 [Kitasatospora sp. NPDC101801]|uniref:hypothetical protein n=1 Tax=Kitasatospora sp. NPDC101801 TaxID=3364103 RepID=UPI0038031DD8
MSAIRCKARQDGPSQTSTQVVLRIVAARRAVASVRSASAADHATEASSATAPTALIPTSLAAAFPDLSPAALQHILGL